MKNIKEFSLNVTKELAEFEGDIRFARELAEKLRDLGLSSIYKRRIKDEAVIRYLYGKHTYYCYKSTEKRFGDNKEMIVYRMFANVGDMEV